MSQVSVSGYWRRGRTEEGFREWKSDLARPGGRQRRRERPRRVRGVQTGVPRSIDDGLARRLKALACTAPLHDLDARKSRLDWADAERYQMAEIGLQAIDQVTLAMDFDHGAAQPEVVRRLVPFIAAQAPDAPPAEHERVGHWVIENLINVGTPRPRVRRRLRLGRRRRPLRAAPLRLQAARRARRRPDGEVYLRASDEAINVLVGALDTDVESAQVAAEVKLENLISRGRLGDARLAAEQARYRTVQYAEALRQKLDATRRDVRSVDWLAAVPALLDEALTHIEGRYRAETAILANIADRPRRGDRAGAAPAGRRAGRRRARLHPAPHPAAGPAAGGGRGVPGRAGPPAVRRPAAARRDRRVRPAAAAVPRPARRDRAGARPRRSSGPAPGCGCRACPASAAWSRRCWRRRRTATRWASRCPSPSWSPAEPDRVRRRSSGARSPTRAARVPGTPCGCPRCSPTARAVDPELPQLVALRVAARGRDGHRHRPQPGRRRGAAGRRRRHGAAGRRVRRGRPARRDGGASCGATAGEETREPRAAGDVESAARLVALRHAPQGGARPGPRLRRPGAPLPRGRRGSPTPCSGSRPGSGWWCSRSATRRGWCWPPSRTRCSRSGWTSTRGAPCWRTGRPTR